MTVRRQFPDRRRPDWNDMNKPAFLALGAAQAAIPVYGFVVKNTYPHDPQAFTQGLFFKDGQLYETTGQTGQSSLRRVDLKPARCCRRRIWPPNTSAKDRRPSATPSSA
jgi:glutamine cyclotransferase